MKKIVLSVALVVGVALSVYLIAADHIDAPAVGSLSTGSTAADITDYYAFESPSNSSNYVFVCNVMGLTAPGATADAAFGENLIYEFNIDTNNDQVEDLVIQAAVRNNTLTVYGPVAPTTTGAASVIETSGNQASVAVTSYGETAKVGESGGVKVFAGSRDDPFFMDFFKFVDIVNGAGDALGIEVAAPADGNAYATSFSETGADTFAGSNVLSIVVELPKSMLGSSDTFNSWVESKRK